MAGNKDVLDGEALDLLSKAESVNRLRNLTGMNFVLTGAMSLSRTDMTRLIIALGGTVQQGVGASTTMVILSDAHSTSSKARHARNFGTQIMTEQEFAEYLSKPS